MHNSLRSVWDWQDIHSALQGISTDDGGGVLVLDMHLYQDSLIGMGQNQHIAMACNWSVSPLKPAKMSGIQTFVGE